MTTHYRACLADDSEFCVCSQDGGQCGSPPEVMEDMLERAKRGKIRGVAIAAACDQRSDATVYALGDEGIAPLVLACERVKLRLLEHCE